jgi:drug/metabolite transporter (DMT)-like permease
VSGEPATRRRPSAELLLLVATLLWALNTPAVKFGVGEISPLAFPVIRFLIGGTMMMIVVRLREGSVRIERRDFRLIVVIALLGVTVNQACFVYALTYTGASDVAFLFAAGPLVTALLATAVGMERLGRRHWAGALAGFIGIGLIVVGRVGASFGATPLIGALLALASITSSSASALPISFLLDRYSAWRIIAWELLVGSVMLLPFAIPSIAAQDFGRVSAGAWLALGYTVIFSAVVANVIYFTAIGKVGPSRAAMYGYLQSMLAVLFAVVLLGERVVPIQLLGGLIVIGSVILSGSARAQPGERLKSRRPSFGLPAGGFISAARDRVNGLRGRSEPPTGEC